MVANELTVDNVKVGRVATEVGCDNNPAANRNILYGGRTIAEKASAGDGQSHSQRRENAAAMSLANVVTDRAVAYV